MDQFCLYNYDDFTEEQYAETFADFLFRKEELQKNVIRMLLKEDETKHYGININFLELLEHCDRTASVLMAYASRLLPIFDEAIKAVEQQILQVHKRKDEMCFKPNVHARLVHLQMCGEHFKVIMPRSCDIGRFVEVQGTIIRTGAIKMLEWERTYQCGTCKHRFTARADPEQRNSFPRILSCPSERPDKPCPSRNFKMVPGTGICRDYQEIKIQENVGQLGVGSIPRSLLSVLIDDLVDTCKAGDDVYITGIVKRRWRPPSEEDRCDVDLFLEANSVRVNNQQKLGDNVTDEAIDAFKKFWKKYENNPLEGRNIILKSICPNIYGMFMVKLSVAVALVGGIQRVDKSGMRIRGESHLLLVGEPGTGKSQFLRFAKEISSRSVLTTGIGTTSAGLTVSAVREPGGDFMLEAGALVLADGGVCCIDEFSSIREKDRSTIHEAMEQQTLSVAKAGLVCKLQTRCTVIAATNPKGKYDPLQNISVNTTLASPLLSRFDLVLVLVDDQNPEWDKQVSSFILETQSQNSNSPWASCWPMQILRAYFNHVKTIKPELTPEAKEILCTYYRKQRGADMRNSARTTIRLLESLSRIAHAHARIMFRNRVTIQDALVAVQLMECSMQTSALLGVNSTLHSMFPEKPDEEYVDLQLRLLRSLNLSYLAGKEESSSQDSNFPSKKSSTKRPRMDEGKEEEEEEEEEMLLDIMGKNNTTKKPNTSPSKKPINSSQQQQPSSQKTVTSPFFPQKPTSNPTSQNQPSKTTAQNNLEEDDLEASFVLSDNQEEEEVEEEEYVQTIQEQQRNNIFDDLQLSDDDRPIGKGQKVMDKPIGGGGSKVLDKPVQNLSPNISPQPQQPIRNLSQNPQHSGQTPPAKKKKVFLED